MVSSIRLRDAGTVAPLNGTVILFAPVRPRTRLLSYCKLNGVPVIARVSPSVWFSHAMTEPGLLKGLLIWGSDGVVFPPLGGVALVDWEDLLADMDGEE